MIMNEVKFIFIFFGIFHLILTTGLFAYKILKFHQISEKLC